MYNKNIRRKETAMNKTNVLILVSVVTLVVGVATMFVVVSNHREDLTIAESVCQYSHKVNSGRWEDACGQLQDETNTEFLCDELSADAHCWLEEK